MVRKPASMYRQIKGQAYTRREYMGGVPASRVSQYEMGNLREDFPVVLTLRVKNRVQIRHTSIEAGRIAANKVLNGQIGVANYHMTVRAYPHVVLRENKLATGAGADRVSSGMRQGFGKTVGTAARLERNQAHEVPLPLLHRCREGTGTHPVNVRFRTGNHITLD